MEILVTGAAGYIGSHTMLELLNAGYIPIALDNFSNSSCESLKRVEKLAGKSFKIYECDILDRSGLEKIFKNHNIEAVIHFAGLKAVGESNEIPLKYYLNNVNGSVVLFEVMEKFNCKKLVFSSSATIYGDNVSPFDETMPTGNVTNPYGRTKFIIEEILFDLQKSDVSWSIALLRYFNPIGAHESGQIGEDPAGVPNNLMPYISQTAVGKRPHVNVFGDDYETHDGTGVRDYIHVTDLALGHLSAIEFVSKNVGIEAINLGTGIGYSVFDAIKAMEKASGKKIDYKVAPRREGDLGEVYANPAKALSLLGFRTTRGIDKMCEDAWRWQSENPDGYNC